MKATITHESSIDRSRSMERTSRIAAAFLTALLCISAPVAAQRTDQPSKLNVENQARNAVLWCDPVDITSRDLFYGPGGDRNAPRSTIFTYEKEDLKGTSPKFDVRDENDVKWRIKLGEEARPETVATRLLWAVGYFTDEDYFLPQIQVKEMQMVSKQRRKRTQGLLQPDGTMINVRLKRYPEGTKKRGTWQWRENPFKGTRELNGLRVMMAVINNWDVKDENNSVYFQKDGRTHEQTRESDDAQMTYSVSDLGASFGTAGRTRDRALAKGNLDAYRRSKFIRKIDPDYVDFNVPARESWILVVNPREYVRRLRLRWIGRHIPRADARWMGQVLARLSPEQIRDAFRAAGYSPEQVDAFSNVVERRIGELNEL